MYLPQFVTGMFITSAVVGAWTYVAKGSIWKAVAWGIIVAVLLQVGYFALQACLRTRRRAGDGGDSPQLRILMKYGRRGMMAGIGWRVFPRFLIGMVVTSGALVTWAYGATGSLWNAAAWAVVVSILLQIGYLALVLGLASAPRDGDRAPDEGAAQTASRVAE